VANHLSQSYSPYLRQHAENPVDWYEWGDEALSAAKNLDRPILVSIGYSACHWCHVMAHESFDDVRTASLMNANFINIKVDREERPDIDAVYMDAVQALTGQGGWPLNVFLTPDREPFFGGTYWPPTPRHGMPAWSQVVAAVADAWQTSKDGIQQSASQIQEALVRLATRAGSGKTVDSSVLEVADRALEANFDEEHGGFGGAPKFPQPVLIDFLLREYDRANDTTILEMATKSLLAIVRGGIHDHIGGGFHRYSVDAEWRVPHFEKMLSDNALLLRVIADAWRCSREPEFSAAASGIVEFLSGPLRAPNGGFYASLDADSEGVEGKYFVWNRAEIAEVLDGPEEELFIRHYGVQTSDSFEGSNVLRVVRPIAELAIELDQDAGELHRMIDDARTKLYERRSMRIPPATDVKILTDWNFLAVEALAHAGRAFDQPQWIAMAREAATEVLCPYRSHGRLTHVVTGPESKGPAFLVDYAYGVNALLELYETTGEEEWLSTATGLASALCTLFEESGLYYDAANDAASELPVRTRSLTDGPVPSGTAATATAFLRLSALNDCAIWEPRAITLLRQLPHEAARNAAHFSGMLSAVNRSLQPKEQVLVVGEGQDPLARSLTEAAFAIYLPNTVVLTAAAAQRHGGLDVTAIGPAAFICRNFTCGLPITSPQALNDALSKPRAT
jgi:uncharacterized protein YyaL (SSP411 family)